MTVDEFPEDETILRNYCCLKELKLCAMETNFFVTSFYTFLAEFLQLLGLVLDHTLHMTPLVDHFNFGKFFHKIIFWKCPMLSVN